MLFKFRCAIQRKQFNFYTQPHDIKNDEESLAITIISNGTIQFLISKEVKTGYTNIQILMQKRLQDMTLQLLKS